VAGGAFPPVVGVGLVTKAILSGHPGAAVAGAVAGALPPLVYTLVLAREGRLFLRAESEIVRSRSQIRAVGIPLGWALAAVTLLAATMLEGSASVILSAMLGGAALGFWPGLLANFLRLRREQWTRQP
jgi:hypothetical protein